MKKITVLELPPLVVVEANLSVATNLWIEKEDEQVARDTALFVITDLINAGVLQVSNRVHPVPLYDPEFGDDRKCKCSHIYYRHFDTYEDMEPVGCKYCLCGLFNEDV